MEQDSDLLRGCRAINSENSKCKCRGGKLDVYDWLENLPKIPDQIDIVEIQFKNTRKGFYKNINKINLKRGDVVAVEASPGHDIGTVTLVGELVFEQMKKNKVPWNESRFEFKKVYRKAKPIDIEKWQTAIDQEQEIMLRARELAAELKLCMKIGDVELQGDKTKAIFYYIADERVDFRELIKVFAEEFKVRVEMRQIGARQEAGRIGGIGSCGRELCCSTWMTNFNSVTTNSARMQELSLNPLKLAGQCGKLKCCLNYELDAYSNAREDFPSSQTILQTTKGPVYCQKIDIFKSIMWFSHDQHSSLNMVDVPVDRVKQIIALNKKGKKIEHLIEEKDKVKVIKEPDYENVVGQESLTRFDKKETKRKRTPRNFKNKDDNKRVPHKKGDAIGNESTANRPVRKEVSDKNTARKVNAPRPNANRDNHKRDTKKKITEVNTTETSVDKTNSPNKEGVEKTKQTSRPLFNKNNKNRSRTQNNRFNKKRPPQPNSNSVNKNAKE